MEASRIWSEHFRSFIFLFPSSKRLPLCCHEQYIFCVAGGDIILLHSGWLQRPPLRHHLHWEVDTRVLLSTCGLNSTSELTFPKYATLLAVDHYVESLMELSCRKALSRTATGTVASRGIGNYVGIQGLCITHITFNWTWGRSCCTCTKIHRNQIIARWCYVLVWERRWYLAKPRNCSWVRSISVETFWDNVKVYRNESNFDPVLFNCSGRY